MDPRCAEILPKAVELLRRFDQVQAVGLGGSQASGAADRHSDLDLQAVTVREHPDVSCRKAIYGSTPGVEIGPVNHCVAADFEAPPFSTSFAVDWLRVDGMRCDVLWVTQEGMERAFTRIQEDIEHPETAAVWARDVQSLVDPRGFLQRLLARCPEYTEQRARKKACARLKPAHFFICTWGVLDKAIRRHDIPGYYQGETYMISTLVSALYAVNRTWQHHLRGLRSHARSFQILPADFVDRLESVICRRSDGDPIETACRELRLLFQDLAVAADRAYPHWKLPLEWPEWTGQEGPGW